MQRAAWRLLIGILIVLPLAAQQAAPAPDWKAWEFMMGTWVGEASGSPGEGAGWFSFAPDLQGRVLIRRNHTEFPAAVGRPASVHDDLLIVGQEPTGTRAVYWDNEGHVIYYAVQISPDGAVTFVSASAPGAPRFRLSYRKLAESRLGIRFEIAPPGKPDDFKIYLDGTARKK